MRSARRFDWEGRGGRGTGGRGRLRRSLLVTDTPAERARDRDEMLWPAVGLFVAGWLAFSWPWLSGTVTIPWDAKAHFLPQVQFLAASIARGDWPFWTPNVFAGHPQIADPQSQMFSPPMLLLALLDPTPGNHAIDTAVLLCLLAAGLGVIWLFRDLGWHSAGGLIAALGFAFGAAMAWRLQHYGQVLSLAYLPFALLFLKRALERRSAVYGLLAGVVAGCIVNGRDQVGLLEVYLLAAFVVTYLASRDDIVSGVVGSIKPLVAGAVGGIAVALVPVVLTVLLAAQSNRPEIDFTGAGRGSLHPALLLTAFAAHLYGAAGAMADFWGPPSYVWRGTDLFTAQNVGECYIGALPLLLLIVGIVRGDLWAREIRFFTVALGVSLLYALGWYTPVFGLMYEVLPGVSLYRRPADAVFLIGGLGAITAGYVMHRLASEIETKLAARALIIVAAYVGAGFVMMATVAGAMDRLPQAMAPLLLALICFAAAAGVLGAAVWLRPIRPLAALALVGGTTAVDIAYNNGPNGASGLPPSFVEMLEPNTRSETIALLKRKVAEGRSDVRRDRVELAGLGFNWPNASLTHDLENTLGYNPVRLGIYSAATGAEDHAGLPDQRKFSALFPSYRSLLADLLGLRFIATGVPITDIDKRLRVGDLPLVARTGDGYVYENTQALPRVLFAARSEPADFDRLLRDGVWPEFDPRTTVLLQPRDAGAMAQAGAAPAGAGSSGTVASRRVRIVSYRNTDVVIEADSESGGFVVLNDVWQPWWFAEVDGAPAPMLRANGLFRAVKLPPGRHVVRFTFRPLAGALAQIAGRDLP